MKKEKNNIPAFFKAVKIKSDIERLLESAPFDVGAKASSLFTGAMRSAMRSQLKHSAFLKSFYNMEKYFPSKLKSEADISKIPFISVNGFKERDLTTLPKNKIVLELSSSGTSGQRSRMLLDRDSLIRVRRMAWKVFEGLGLTDLDHKLNYICFTYDPAVAKDLGTAWTDKLLTDLTGQGEIFYAFKWDKKKNDFYFDIEGSVAALKKFEEMGERTRILGFPAFALKLAEEFKKKYGRYAKLNKDSSVITGGGWKTLSNEAIDKKIYRKILADNFSLPVKNVRDLFGMVEHGVPYVDCKLGNFHIPNYGRIIVRDPGTLKPLGYGKSGLLQFITPYLTSYPSISILSTDFGRVEKKCSCGLKGPVLFIEGRAGVKKHKGCAISASTML
ncbi:MAG: hypothetical protein U9Q34_03575 [Elusimicrobiota bacterium]|nr:hypothetical protein [Elusimicrobiota bacterium]